MLFRWPSFTDRSSHSFLAATTARALGVVLIAVATARGQLSSFNPGPFNASWDLEARPMNGEVQKVEWFREVAKPGAATPERRLMHTTEFFTLPSGEVEGRTGPARAPHTLIAFDKSGRPVRLIANYHAARSGGATERVTSTETFEYDAQGLPHAFSIDKSDAQSFKATLEKSPAPGGGSVLTWTYTDDRGQPWRAQITYNAARRLVEYTAAPVAAKAPPRPTRLTYNDAGDVATVGNPEPYEAYEYEYDQKKNWTRRTRFRINNGKREPGEVEARVLHYGAPRRGPAGAVPPAKPAMAVKTAPIDRSKLAGTYEQVVGKPGSGVSATTKIEIKADETASFESQREFRDQRFKNAATATWSVSADGRILTVQLEKSDDGTPIPPAVRQLNFCMTTEGHLVPAHATGTEPFKRQSPGKPQAPTGGDGLD